MTPHLDALPCASNTLELIEGSGTALDMNLQRAGARNAAGMTLQALMAAAGVIRQPCHKSDSQSGACATHDQVGPACERGLA